MLSLFPYNAHSAPLVTGFRMAGWPYLNCSSDYLVAEGLPQHLLFHLAVHHENRAHAHHSPRSQSRSVGDTLKSDTESTPSCEVCLSNLRAGLAWCVIRMCTCTDPHLRCTPWLDPVACTPKRATFRNRQTLSAQRPEVLLHTCVQAFKLHATEM